MQKLILKTNDMDQFKGAQLVILPTTVAMVKNSLLYLYPDGQLLKSPAGNQHLYFISDDEIKEGDWITGIEKDWGIYGEVHQVQVIRNLESGQLFWFNKSCNGISAIPEQCKKIIATTDNELGYGDNVGAWYSLPQPSQQFIEKYIESYNKGKVITNVLVEYEEMTENELDCDPAYYPLEQRLKLKIKPRDNTITTKKVKESWNREEHIADIRRLIHTLYYSPNREVDFDTKEELDNWIDKNL